MKNKYNKLLIILLPFVLLSCSNSSGESTINIDESKLYDYLNVSNIKQEELQAYTETTSSGSISWSDDKYYDYLTIVFTTTSNEESMTFNVSGFTLLSNDTTYDPIGFLSVNEKEEVLSDTVTKIFYSNSLDGVTSNTFIFDSETKSFEVNLIFNFQEIPETDLTINYGGNEIKSYKASYPKNTDVYYKLDNNPNVFANIKFSNSYYHDYKYDNTVVSKYIDTQRLGTKIKTKETKTTKVIDKTEKVLFLCLSLNVDISSYNSYVLNLNKEDLSIKVDNEIINLISFKELRLAFSWSNQNEFHEEYNYQRIIDVDEINIIPSTKYPIYLNFGLDNYENITDIYYQGHLLDKAK